MTSCSEKEGDHFPLLILQSHWLLDLSSLIDPRLNPEPTNLTPWVRTNSAHVPH